MVSLHCTHMQTGPGERVTITAKQASPAWGHTCAPLPPGPARARPSSAEAHTPEFRESTEGRVGAGPPWGVAVASGPEPSGAMPLPAYSGSSGWTCNLCSAEGALATPGPGGSASLNKLPRPVFPEVLKSGQTESLKADKGGVFFLKVLSLSLGGNDLVEFGEYPRRKF